MHPVNRLTRQEQLVLCAVLGLLLVGLAVKTYREAHPSTALVSPAAGPSSNRDATAPRATAAEAP
jgi:hypothetical protein